MHDIEFFVDSVQVDDVFDTPLTDLTRSVENTMFVGVPQTDQLPQQFETEWNVQSALEGSTGFYVSGAKLLQLQKQEAYNIFVPTTKVPVNTTTIEASQDTQTSLGISTTPIKTPFYWA